MTRFKFAPCAIASAAFAMLTPGLRAARPQYGGTLVVQSEAVVRSVEPTIVDGDSDSAQARMSALLFEPLVAIDGLGGLRPALATAWERDARFVRWRFQLRTPVMLHDRTSLDAARVAAALAARERAWRVVSDGDSVIVDLDRPNAELPWVLADGTHGIAIRAEGGALVGSGPFRLDRFDASRVLLRAHDDYWGGRAFVDAVQIEQGRQARAAVASIEAGRADFAAVSPTDVRRLADRGLRTVSSRPMASYVLIFEPHRAQSADDEFRAAVAAAVDGATLSSVWLQRQAEPADGLLPAWISGYAPLLRREQPRVAAVSTTVRRSLIVRIDTADALAKTIADRLVADGRERRLDIAVQTPNGLAPRPDARLVRVPVHATTPGRALALAMQTLGGRAVGLLTNDAPPPIDAPLDSVLRLERTLLQYNVIIPVVHVDDVYGLGDRVESWNEAPVSPSGGWNIASLWLRGERPSPR